MTKEFNKTRIAKKNNSQFSILNSQFGFTLIELMVAITIIALLVAAGYGMYLTSLRRGQDTKRQGDMKSFQNAMEQYYSVNQAYPANTTVAATQFSTGVLPVDPLNSGSFVYSYTTVNAATYCVCAKLQYTGAANSGNVSCGYAVSPKTHFCVSNLQ